MLTTLAIQSARSWRLGAADVGRAVAVPMLLDGGCRGGGRRRGQATREDAGDGQGEGEERDREAHVGSPR